MIRALEEQETRLEFQNEMLAQQNQELESQRQQVLRQNQELESQRQQVLLQNLQLLEAARLKSQFLATMSHELRTPMNAVIGFSQLLLRQRQSSLTPQQVDMVERILNNGKNLLTLINEILDLSKIEAGRLELKLETFNLVKLLRATLGELRSLADQKHLELDIQADLQNPNVSNDSVRLRQILVNLLSNAIKFTECGKVQVKVKEISSDQLAIIVQDTGIGIAQDDLEHIFEEFRQIDQTTTRKYSGTGLGLAITKSLVQLMHGKIIVESEVGQGSIFCIELPREVPADDPCKCSYFARPVSNATASLSTPNCKHKLNHCTRLKASTQDGSVLSESLKGSGIGKKILY
jgi:signal transduction histidine kinase